MTRGFLPYCLLSIAVHAGAIAVFGLNSAGPQPVAKRGSELALIEFVVTESSEQEQAASPPSAPAVPEVESETPSEAALPDSSTVERVTEAEPSLAPQDDASVAKKREPVVSSVDERLTQAQETLTSQVASTAIAPDPQLQTASIETVPARQRSRSGSKGDAVEASVARLVRPVYPRAARRAGQEGRVVLEALVSKDGRVLDVAVVEGSGFESLDDAATRALRKSRFRPARVGGVAIDDSAQVSIRFQLEDGD